MDSIKKLRQISGLSQSEFAKKYHINIFTLQQWERERNKIPDHMLYALNRVIKEIDYKK